LDAREDLGDALEPSLHPRQDTLVFVCFCPAARVAGARGGSRRWAGRGARRTREGAEERGEEVSPAVGRASAAAGERPLGSGRLDQDDDRPRGGPGPRSRCDPVGAGSESAPPEAAGEADAVRPAPSADAEAAYDAARGRRPADDEDDPAGRAQRERDARRAPALSAGPPHTSGPSADPGDAGSPTPPRGGAAWLLGRRGVGL
jgi:hypothetical protein